MRVVEPYLLECGQLKDMAAQILADVDHGRIVITGVMVGLELGKSLDGTVPMFDVSKLLNVSTLVELKEFIRSRHLHLVQDAVVDWDMPDGAA